MRLVTEEADLTSALRAARSEAQSSFGDASVYLERRLVGPRHIEVQHCGDVHGTVLPFVERECSIQRRHQKVLEESPVGRDRTRRAARPDGRRGPRRTTCRLHERRHHRVPARRHRAVLLPRDEHAPAGGAPVTEMVTGVDLVEWQLRLAAGEPLTLDPHGLAAPRGQRHRGPHLRRGSRRPVPAVTRPRDAPAARGGAGHPRRRRPHGAGRRAHLLRPLVAKLIAWGSDRTHAISRLARALREYEIEGIKTTIPFFRWLLTNEDYVAARVDTTWLDLRAGGRAGEPFWAATSPLATSRRLRRPSRRARRARPGAAPTAPTPAFSEWAAAARREALR